MWSPMLNYQHHEKKCKQKETKQQHIKMSIELPDWKGTTGVCPHLTLCILSTWLFICVTCNIHLNKWVQINKVFCWGLANKLNLRRESREKILAEACVIIWDLILSSIVGHSLWPSQGLTLSLSRQYQIEFNCRLGNWIICSLKYCVEWLCKCREKTGLQMWAFLSFLFYPV